MEEASDGGWPICRALGFAQQRLADRKRVSPADAEKCRSASWTLILNVFLQERNSDQREKLHILKSLMLLPLRALHVPSLRRSVSSLGPLYHGQREREVLSEAELKDWDV